MDGTPDTNQNFWFTKDDEVEEDVDPPLPWKDPEAPEDAPKESGAKDSSEAEEKGCWGAFKKTALRPLAPIFSTVGRISIIVISIGQLVVGLVLIALGVVMMTSSINHVDGVKHQEKEYAEVMEKYIEPGIMNNGTAADYGALLHGVSRVCLGYGVTAATWSLLGCCCGLIPYRTCTIVYVLICSVALVTECVVTYIIYTDEDFGKAELLDSLKNYTGAAATDATTKAWDIVMYSFSCCGVDNYHDFEGLDKWPPLILQERVVNLTTPLVCCNKKKLQMSMDCALSGLATQKNNNMEKGCYMEVSFKAVKQVIEVFALPLIGSKAAIVIIVSCMLYTCL